MAFGVTSLLPPWVRGYQKEWLVRDLVAGATLAAVAMPECMGYTSIAQTPIVTGLYTIIFPTILFVVLGSSRLLVVGADSATAALFAAGLTGAAITGVTPGSQQWLAYTSVIAIICGGMLLVARVFRLGFLGDFLSASVLIGFLTGVGVQVATGQLPDMFGIPKGTGNWLQQQWDFLTSLGSTQWATLLYALATVAIIKGFERFLPKVPGAIVAVLFLILLSTVLDSAAHGVTVIGAVQGGFPPIGLPQGITASDVMSNMATLVGIAFSCFILIIAQSAATSRSFAMKHGQPVDINRDIVGLSGANFAAGLSGTFVVNGSPTKTQILDGQKGHTQLANLTMSVLTLLVVLFFTSILTNMPKAVLAGIVFLIGISLIDIKGLKIVAAARKSEFIVAVVTAVVVCAVGVEQGIMLAILVSILDLVRRQYRPKDFVVGVNEAGQPTYEPAKPGTVSQPGLIIFRYDAELFYANANRFVDDIEALITSAPEPVEWLILDASSLDDVDYSAGKALGGLLDFLDAKGIAAAIARADTSLDVTLERYGLEQRIPADRRFGNLTDAYAAFTNRARAASS
jgi:MFS superfamily sulfate permease-like transporter